LIYTLTCHTSSVHIPSQSNYCRKIFSLYNSICVYFNFKGIEQGGDINLYAKIDNSVGLENIDDILTGVDGVFLNRPNLSMEVGHDKIFLAQKIVLSKCNLVIFGTLIVVFFVAENTEKCVKIILGKSNLKK